MLKRFIALMVLAGVGASLVLVGCQSKEVTSAKVYIQQDDWAKATEQLEMAVKLYPQDAEAHFLLGQAYAQRGDFEGMRKEFDASLAISPRFEPRIKHEIERHWVSYFNNGVKKVNAGQLEAAKKDFETCLVIDPQHLEAYKNLGYTYVQLDSLPRAIAMYEKVVELAPTDKDALRSLTSLYMQAEEFPQVLKVADKRLALDPGDVDALSTKALAYDYMGEGDKALAEYERALEQQPENTDLLFNLGRLHYLRGEYEKAIEQFQKVIDKNPEDADALVNVGNAYLSIGDQIRKRAVEEEEKGKRFTEKEIEALKKEIEKYHCGAIPYLEKAVQIKPDNANAWNNLGVAYVNCGRREDGEKAFDRAAELRK
ncbi:MAG: tetratricopeptide repeat protein [candidate division KSB1 bacterium]|nr:tetratricopeptide repeat protein [candidate division KSB1 bacterium]MDZ7293953.1 tetratricopeptide repeat protein [candidate division KSB1 bacterium]